LYADQLTLYADLPADFSLALHADQLALYADQLALYVDLPTDQLALYADLPTDQLACGCCT
jgi:hypothetical protein